MLEFEPITLKDRDWCRNIALAEDSRSSDFGFASMYMWDGRYKQKLCRCGDRLIVKLRYEELPFFAFPIGTGPIEPVIRQMKEFADFRGWPLRISGITDENRALMEQKFPDCFVYCDDVSFFDYMYRTESLATLAGKKLHGKKNHCNRFEAENTWDFVPLTRELVPGCLEMLETWTNENADRLSDGIADEHDAIVRGFDAFEELELLGGVLRIDGRIVGFTVGDIINSDTCDVHFEKAYTEINGAYPMVTREFARMMQREHPEIVYLNREDDMGQESMRRAKESFQPEYLLKKYTARYLCK
jgi:hypothetical protein